MQAELIRRYAARHGLAIEAAACLWIRARARMFRAWFTAHRAA